MTDATLLIEPTEVLRRIAAGERVRFVDMRGEAAWLIEQEPISGAIRHRPSDRRLPEVEKEGVVIVIFCS
jgi:hypothetical protein